MKLTPIIFASILLISSFIVIQFSIPVKAANPITIVQTAHQTCLNMGSVNPRCTVSFNNAIGQSDVIITVVSIQTQDSITTDFTCCGVMSASAFSGTPDILAVQSRYNLNTFFLETDIWISTNLPQGGNTVAIDIGGSTAANFPNNNVSITAFDVQGVFAGLLSSSYSATGVGNSTAIQTSTFATVPTGPYLAIAGVTINSSLAHTFSVGTGFSQPSSVPNNDIGFVEYSTSGLTTQTNFPMSSNIVLNWAEAGIVLIPGQMLPISFSIIYTESYVLLSFRATTTCNVYPTSFSISTNPPPISNSFSFYLSVQSPCSNTMTIDFSPQTYGKYFIAENSLPSLTINVQNYCGAGNWLCNQITLHLYEQFQINTDKTPVYYNRFGVQTSTTSSDWFDYNSSITVKGKYQKTFTVYIARNTICSESYPGFPININQTQSGIIILSNNKLTKISQNQKWLNFTATPFPNAGSYNCYQIYFDPDTNLIPRNVYINNVNTPQAFTLSTDLSLLSFRNGLGLSTTYIIPLYAPPSSGGGSTPSSGSGGSPPSSGSGSPPSGSSGSSISPPSPPPIINQPNQVPQLPSLPTPLSPDQLNLLAFLILLILVFVLTYSYIKKNTDPGYKLRKSLRPWV